MVAKLRPVGYRVEAHGVKVRNDQSCVWPRSAACPTRVIAPSKLLGSGWHGRAPFSGCIGRNQAPVGTLVSVAGTVLNTLVQLDPIYVYFNPSETDLIAIEKARKSGVVSAEILQPGETQSHHQGELSFLNNVVDHATRTIAARAVIANGDFALLPGQYVRVRLHIWDEPDALMVPQAALGSSQLGKYLYIVGKDNVVEQRLVSLGASDGGLVTVEKGVSEGDQVIDGSLKKIGPGMPVRPLPHSLNWRDRLKAGGLSHSWK